MQKEQKYETRSSALVCGFLLFQHLCPLKRLTTGSLQAAEKKEQTKGFFSGVFGGNKGDDEAEEKGKNLKDKASDTLSSAEDK